MENLEKIKNRRFWRNKTVLVTGHEGFLGSWLSKTLIDLNANVIGLDIVKYRPNSVLNCCKSKVVCIKGNVSDFRLVKKTITRYKPAVIFHLAAEAIVGRANKNPSRTFKSNIEGTWNILEASRNKKFVKAIVAASSDKAYGCHKDLPYREDTTPLKGSHPYDVSKSCADLLCYTYYNTYNVPVCVTRCGNIYGYGDHNLSRLVPDAMRSAIEDLMLVIRSDGKFTRDYIYVEDIVSGYIKLAEAMTDKKIHGEAFNFSNEDPISVIDLVKLINKTAGKEDNYTISNSAKYEIRNQFLSSEKAKKILKWLPRYTLEEGLKKTMNQHRAHFKKI